MEKNNNKIIANIEKINQKDLKCKRKKLKLKISLKDRK